MASTPETLEVLHDVPLRNGNVQRLEVHRYGAPPRCVVLLGVRELICPELVHRARPTPEVFLEGPDGRPGWGVGRAKDLRIDHLEWIVAHGERVLQAMRLAKARTISDGVDLEAFGGGSSRGGAR